MEDHLAKAHRLATANLRVKGSSFDASTDRKTSLLRDRPAKGVRSSAPYRIWVSDAAHHCVQLRVDLLFTMSDNLHRVIEDRRDTNSSSWTSIRSRNGSRCFRSTVTPLKAWWSQTGSNRRPPACKAGALPTELWPLAVGRRLVRMVGLGRLELPTSRLSSARSNQLSYKPETVVPKSCDDFRSDRARLPTRKIFCARSRGAGSSMKEREMKTAVSCQWT